MHIQASRLDDCGHAANLLAQSSERFHEHHRLNEIEACTRVAEERQTAGALLLEAMRRREQIPIALDSNRSSLDHRARALFRKLHAESGGDIEATRQSLSRVRGFCSDFGDIGMASVSGFNFRDGVPKWMQVDIELDDEASAHEGDLGPVTSQHFLPHCVESPGMCHIIDNLTNDVHMPLGKKWPGRSLFSTFPVAGGVEDDSC